MLSASDIFYASAALFLLLVGVIWLARPSSRASVTVETTSARPIDSLRPAALIALNGRDSQRLVICGPAVSACANNTVHPPR